MRLPGNLVYRVKRYTVGWKNMTSKGRESNYTVSSAFYRMGVRFMFGFSDTPNHPVLIKVGSIMCPLYVRFTGQLGWVLELEIRRKPSRHAAFRQLTCVGMRLALKERIDFT